jgi:hypothetical protein
VPYKYNVLNNQLDFYESTGSVVITDPPSTMYKVTNLYVDPATNKLIVKYDNTAGLSAGSIISTPPTGKYRVTNVFVNPTNGRLIVRYDNTPAT